MPGAQFEHTVEVVPPIPAVDVPLGQGVHAVDPVAAAYWPAVQLAHTAEVVPPVPTENVPVGQNVHAVDPIAAA